MTAVHAAFALWLAGAPSGAAAQAPQAAPAEGAGLEEANRFYQQGQYARAMDAYQALLKRDPAGAVLHYNLANAVFKAGARGSLGRAIAGYWRAYRLKPRDPDIRHNLDFALRKAGESLIPAGTPQALDFLFHYFSEAELLGLQWLGYWACLLLGAAFVWGPGTRQALKPWLVGALAFWALSGSWWAARKLLDVSDPGVVVEANAEARSGPGANFPVGFTAPEGRRVTILADRGDWLEVGVLKEGLKGWMPAKAVERLSP